MTATVGCTKKTALLEQILQPLQRPLLLSRRVAADGLEAYELAKRRGYEGLVAKQPSSPTWPAARAAG